MWLFTKSGFLSIVQHREHPDQLLIRARLRADLESFVARLNVATGKSHQIVEMELADYRFRATAAKADVARAVADVVSDIDYPNFKAAVHGDPRRDAAYMRVWGAMRTLQDAAETATENQIMVIAPYWLDELETWAFDDERVGLMQEPFVAGADTYIDFLARDIPTAHHGFRLVFSAGPFPGWQARLSRQRAKFDGHWYRDNDAEMEGWLCPALFRYFDVPPETLYCKTEPIDGTQN